MKGDSETLDCLVIHANDNQHECMLNPIKEVVKKYVYSVSILSNLYSNSIPN